MGGSKDIVGRLDVQEHVVDLKGQVQQHVGREGRAEPLVGPVVRRARVAKARGQDGHPQPPRARNDAEEPESAARAELQAESRVVQPVL